MAQLIIENEFTVFTIKHRAVCSSDDSHWNGPWRDNLPKAESDAEKHRNKGDSHRVWVETKQTSLVRSLYSE